MKNYNDTIANRTRDPPTCSELHEPNYYYYYYYFVVIVIMIIIIMDLGSVSAPLLSCSTYCSQPKFNSHKIPRSLQCDRYFTLSIIPIRKCHCAWQNSETFRGVQNNSGDNLADYVLTAVKIHTAVWRVVTDVSETPQT
jgi:hypothetical protein